MSEITKRPGVDYVDVSQVTVPASVMRLVPAKLVRARNVLPLRIAPSLHATLVLATSDPDDLTVLDEVAFASGLRVHPVLASRRSIAAALDRHFGPSERPASDRAICSGIGAARRDGSSPRIVN